MKKIDPSAATTTSTFVTRTGPEWINEPYTSQTHALVAWITRSVIGRLKKYDDTVSVVATQPAHSTMVTPRVEEVRILPVPSMGE
jgi:hypothetical protein